ncbi:hypothetical protein [Cupriavidus basilensis]|uniref:hypothetical protein n=1 Tax=Cupriavidus basilensis TaxID=68895 RepID=UPI000A94B61A|nr:hypothetical protein [Cupriavidus basilensis]
MPKRDAACFGTDCMQRHPARDAGGVSLLRGPRFLVRLAAVLRSFRVRFAFVVWPVV